MKTDNDELWTLLDDILVLTDETQQKSNELYAMCCELVDYDGVADEDIAALDTAAARIDRDLDKITRLALNIRRKRAAD